MALFVWPFTISTSWEDVRVLSPPLSNSCPLTLIFSPFQSFLCHRRSNGRVPIKNCRLIGCCRVCFCCEKDCSIYPYQVKMSRLIDHNRRAFYHDPCSRSFHRPALHVFVSSPPQAHSPIPPFLHPLFKTHGSP